MGESEKTRKVLIRAKGYGTTIGGYPTTVPSFLELVEDVRGKFGASTRPASFLREVVAVICGEKEAPASVKPSRVRTLRRRISGRARKPFCRRLLEFADEHETWSRQDLLDEMAAFAKEEPINLNHWFIDMPQTTVKAVWDVAKGFDPGTLRRGAH